MTNSKIIGPNYVQAFINGIPYFADSKHPYYNNIVALLNSNNYLAAEPLFSISNIVSGISHGKIRVENNAVYYNQTVIHNTVCDRILEFLSRGLNIRPLCLFLERLLDNPNPVVVKNLYKYMEKYKLPIDDQGFIHAVKAVQFNLKSKWTDDVQYVLNRTYSEPRSLLLSEKDNANYCGPGLWFGWTDFVFNYGSGNDRSYRDWETDRKSVV